MFFVYNMQDFQTNSTVVLETLRRCMRNIILTAIRNEYMEDIDMGIYVK